MQRQVHPVGPVAHRVRPLPRHRRFVIGYAQRSQQSVEAHRIVPREVEVVVRRRIGRPRKQRIPRQPRHHPGCRIIPPILQSEFSDRTVRQHRRIVVRPDLPHCPGYRIRHLIHHHVEREARVLRRRSVVRHLHRHRIRPRSLFLRRRPAQHSRRAHSQAGRATHQPVDQRLQRQIRVRRHQSHGVRTQLIDHRIRHRRQHRRDVPTGNALQPEIIILDPVHHSGHRRPGANQFNGVRPRQRPGSGSRHVDHNVGRLRHTLGEQLGHHPQPVPESHHHVVIAKTRQGLGSIKGTRIQQLEAESKPRIGGHMARTEHKVQSVGPVTERVRPLPGIGRLIVRQSQGRGQPIEARWIDTGKIEVVVRRRVGSPGEERIRRQAGHGTRRQIVPPILDTELSTGAVGQHQRIVVRPNPPVGPRDRIQRAPQNDIKLSCCGHGRSPIVGDPNHHRIGRRRLLICGGPRKNPGRTHRKARRTADQRKRDCVGWNVGVLGREVDHVGNRLLRGNRHRNGKERSPTDLVDLNAERSIGRTAGSSAVGH